MSVFAFSSRKIFLSKRKRVLKKICAGTVLFLLGVAVFYLYSSLAALFFPKHFLSQPPFILLLMTVLAMVTYKPLDFLFVEIFERYLFKKGNYAHITLMNLADDLELVLDLQELGNLTVNTFGEVLQLKQVAFLIQKEKDQDFQILSAYGWNFSETRRVYLKETSALMNLIRASGPHVLARSVISRTFDWQQANRLSHDFDLLRASWVIPMVIGEEIVGLMAFSTHQADKTFGEADFQFFRKFAHSLAKKVKNAILFQSLKKMNLELQDSQSRMIQMTKLAAIEQLATGIAHQIHNPLTIISGKAQVLLLQKERVPLDERVQEVLKTIVRQTKRAADITKKLVVFSQGSGMPREMLNLEQVLDDTLALISYQTSLETIDITKFVHPGIPPFYANIHEIREIFFNLILNAVQSIGVEGKIHVEMNYFSADKLIELQVTDTGKGIEKEHVDKLFNPFFTTRNEALGLGLFVTKQIVHRYGGSIRVETRYQEGSLFTVHLPVSEKPETGTPEKKSNDLTFHQS